MNIAFFLIPKNEVAYIQYEATMRQALEKMEYHQYSAVPLLDKEGKYVGTLTEGDLFNRPFEYREWPVFHYELKFTEG